MGYVDLYKVNNPIPVLPPDWYTSFPISPTNLLMAFGRVEALAMKAVAVYVNPADVSPALDNYVVRHGSTRNLLWGADYIKASDVINGTIKLVITNRQTPETFYSWVIKSQSSRTQEMAERTLQDVASQYIGAVKSDKSLNKLTVAIGDAMKRVVHQEPSLTEEAKAEIWKGLISTPIPEMFVSQTPSGTRMGIDWATPSTDRTVVTVTSGAGTSNQNNDIWRDSCPSGFVYYPYQSFGTNRIEYDTAILDRYIKQAPKANLKGCVPKADGSSATKGQEQGGVAACSIPIPEPILVKARKAIELASLLLGKSVCDQAVEDKAITFMDLSEEEIDAAIKEQETIKSQIGLCTDFGLLRKLTVKHISTHSHASSVDLYNKLTGKCHEEIPFDLRSFFGGLVQKGLARLEETTPEPLSPTDPKLQQIFMKGRQWGRTHAHVCLGPVTTVTLPDLFIFYEDGKRNRITPTYTFVNDSTSPQRAICSPEIKTQEDADNLHAVLAGRTRGCIIGGNRYERVLSVYWDIA